jgi:hypothetical protein
MASIFERDRATPVGKPFEVRWRGPDLNARGHLREHNQTFATRPEAEAFLAALPPTKPAPKARARCGCPEPRWLLMDVNMLAKGDIVCSVCATPFVTGT